MLNEPQYQLAQERMKEEMRRAAVWRTQRFAMDARRKRVQGEKGVQAKRGLLATITQAFSAWNSSKRDETAVTTNQTRTA